LERRCTLAHRFAIELALASRCGGDSASYLELGVDRLAGAAGSLFHIADMECAADATSRALRASPRALDYTHPRISFAEIVITKNASEQQKAVGRFNQLLFAINASLAPIQLANDAVILDAANVGFFDLDDWNVPGIGAMAARMAQC
jgi:hypothetical protein